MSWPFYFDFSQHSHYFNLLSNLSQNGFPHQFDPNTLLTSVSPSDFNFLGQLSSIPYSNGQLGTEICSTQSKMIISQNSCFNPIRDYSEFKPQTQKLKQKAQMERIQNCLQKDQIRMVRFRRRRAANKPKNAISHNSSLRNDTKNIPKNYGKAMLTYIQKNNRQVKDLMTKYEVDYVEFMMSIKNFKSKINTIHDLREMWGQNQKQNNLKKCIRILSFHFMRKKCLPYIFNSRVKNFHTHIKYRKKIMQGIKDPESFTKIKQF